MRPTPGELGRRSKQLAFGAIYPPREGQVFRPAQDQGATGVSAVRIHEIHPPFTALFLPPVVASCPCLAWIWRSIFRPLLCPRFFILANIVFCPGIWCGRAGALTAVTCTTRDSLCSQTTEVHATWRKESRHSSLVSERYEGRVFS